MFSQCLRCESTAWRVGDQTHYRSCQNALTTTRLTYDPYHFSAVNKEADPVHCFHNTKKGKEVGLKICYIKEVIVHRVNNDYG